MMSLPARILIVEDELVLARNLQKYLGRYAVDVRTANDGAQALEMLHSFTPDALVLDYGLPGMDGLQTYSEIVRRRKKKIRCTMITGNATEKLAQDAHAQGIRHVVCKPFSFAALLNLLEVSGGAGEVGAMNDC